MKAYRVQMVETITRDMYVVAPTEDDARMIANTLMEHNRDITLMSGNDMADKKEIEEVHEEALDESNPDDHVEVINARMNMKELSDLQEELSDD